MTTAQGCSWTTAGAPNWITVTGGGTGSGPGSVAYSVAANAAATPRNATLTIGGQAHAVAQDGREPTVCTYTISPETAAYNKDAATGTFTVAAPASCGWSAVSNQSWLTVTGGAQGSGAGTVAYAVPRNVETAERSGSITVAGRVFTVRQSGDAGAVHLRGGAGRIPALHAGRHAERDDHHAGELSMDRRVGFPVARGRQQRVWQRVGGDQHALFGQLRRAAFGDRDGALADADRRTEHSRERRPDASMR